MTCLSYDNGDELESEGLPSRMGGPRAYVRCCHGYFEIGALLA